MNKSSLISKQVDKFFCHNPKVGKELHLFGSMEIHLQPTPLLTLPKTRQLTAQRLTSRWMFPELHWELVRLLYFSPRSNLAKQNLCLLRLCYTYHYQYPVPWRVYQRI